MAFYSKGKNLFLDEYNYGLGIPFTLSEGIKKDDQFIFSFRTSLQAPVILEKAYTVTEVNDADTFSLVLMFTKEESRRFPRGDYIWSLSHYRNNNLLDTLIENSPLKVKGVA